MTFLPQKREEFSALQPLVDVQNQFVPGAKVVWADYSRLRRDFPGLQSYSEQQIHQWILDNFSYMSLEQSELEGLRHTPLPKSSILKKSFRQLPFIFSDRKRNVHNQGRADVMPALGPQGEHWGYIDRKGVGVTREGVEKNRKILKEQGLEALRMRGGSNGVMLLGQAIVEVAMMNAAQNYLDLINPGLAKPFETIEYYFIIQLPGEALLSEGRTAPLSLVGRQAHVGRLWANNVLVPDRFNTKQFDFFANTIDPETMKIHAAIFNQSRALVTHPRDMELYFTRAQDIVDRYLAGDGVAIQAFINQVNAPLVKAKPANVQSLKRQTLSASYERILSWVKEDPARYHRFAELGVWAIDRNSLDQFSLPLTQQVARLLLRLPKENDPIEKLWARRYGIFLVPALPAAEQKMYLDQEARDPEALQYLAQMIWQIPWELGQYYVSRILNAQAHEFVLSLANKLAQKDVYLDTRYEDFQKYFSMALRHPRSRVDALKYRAHQRSECEQRLL